MRQKRAPRQALMTGGGGIVEPRDTGLKPFSVGARYASADFFPMFDTPFLHGSGWTTAEDVSHARVAVISRALNEKLFGESSGVGREVRFDGNALHVVGVLDTWNPQPLFYDLFGYDRQRGRFHPLFHLARPETDRRGTMNCFGREIVNDQTALNVPCA